MTEENGLTQQSAAKKTVADSSFVETRVFGHEFSGGDADRERSLQSPNASSAQTWVGKVLGKYRLNAVLGHGGMGIVFKAHDPLIERDVAIKLLADHMTADETALGRFLAEARATGKLSHPNVVSIYEICREGDLHFLVMEYLSGGSLADRLESRGPCSVLEATRAMIDVCQGVAAAHAVGLIHRDIKPANFMRATDGTVKVMDFGLAKSAADTNRHMTQVGTVIGTPLFMSPEQCEGRTVDARSDIYSLGATYYALLTGKHAYDDSTGVPQLMFKHCHAPVPDPRSIDDTIPLACSRIIARAMAKSADDRYPSVASMLSDLHAVAATLSGQSQILLPSELGVRQLEIQNKTISGNGRWSRRRFAALAGGLGLVAAIAIASYSWQRWLPTDNNATAPSVAFPVNDEPIKVGVLHSTSGTMAISETVVVDATLLAIEEINRSGGLLGRRVKAIVANGQSDSAKFALQATHLIEEEKVCVLFGCWTSASRKTVKSVVEEHDHLLIYPLQYEGLENSTNVIYMGAAPNQQIIPAVEWSVQELGKKRFFLIGSDYVFPRAANEVVKDRLSALGAEVVGEQYVPLGSQQVQTVVDAIVATRPDMILNTINGDTNTNFFRQLRAAGVTPQTIPCLSFSVGEQELRSLDLATMAGDYAAWTYFESVDTPENIKFVEQFHETYPQRSITDPMECAYAGVMLWAQAVRDVKSLDPKKVCRAMLNARLAAPEGNVRIDPDTQHCYKTPRIGQIRPDGQFQIIWAAPAPITPEPFPNSRTAADWKAFLNDLYQGWGKQWSAPSSNAGRTPTKHSSN